MHYLVILTTENNTPNEQSTCACSTPDYALAQEVFELYHNEKEQDDVVFIQHFKDQDEACQWFTGTPASAFEKEIANDNKIN